MNELIYNISPYTIERVTPPQGNQFENWCRHMERVELAKAALFALCSVSCAALLMFAIVAVVVAL